MPTTDRTPTVSTLENKADTFDAIVNLLYERVVTNPNKIQYTNPVEILEEILALAHYWLTKKELDEITKSAYLNWNKGKAPPPPPSQKKYMRKLLLKK